MAKTRKVSITIGAFQRQFGDFGALDIAREISADAVDFSLSDKKFFTQNDIYPEKDFAVCLELDKFDLL